MTKKQGEIVIFVTTNSADEAHSIANLLLNQRKVACVNIIHGVDSLFWQQDKLDSAGENLLTFKTKASLLDKIVDLVKGIHSYGFPEIIALPIIGGNEDYLKWIGGEVSE